MKKSLFALAGAAALCACLSAHANIVTFNDPGLIAFGSDDIATYSEAGFAFSGQAATFLTLDDSLVGGLDSTASLTVKSAVGGAFSLASFDYALFDLGLGDPPRTLSIVGLRNGTVVAARTFSLGDVATASFGGGGGGFGSLTELEFVSTTGFALDDVDASAVAAVPEPSTTALMSVAMMALVWRMRRARRDV